MTVRRAVEIGAGVRSYTPNLTATTAPPSVGEDGELIGLWYRDGRGWIEGMARIRMLGTGISVGSGSILVDLPWPTHPTLVDVSPGTAVGLGHMIGEGFYRSDTGANTRTLAVQPHEDGRRASLMFTGSNARLNATDLHATQNRIIVFFSYPVDPAAVLI